MLQQIPPKENVIEVCETASNALFTVVKEYSADVMSLFHKLT